ncbi:DadA Glycine/D-amino acid oxidases (deaminating) [Burkholderiaceae bacterium]
MPQTDHVVIIGAGIIGATSAYQCLSAGLRVTLIEPDRPGDEQAASFGNAGWLSSHSVLPPAAPGVWKDVPKWLADPLGPLAIRWKYFPRAFPWLVRYLNAASNYTKIERTAVALRTLLAGAPALHQEMAEQAGVGHLIVRTGLLHAYLSKEHFAKDAKAWDIRKKEGILWKEFNAAELAELEPDLDRRYTFGVLVPETGSCRNPGAYTAALIAHAQARGAQLIRARATGFRIENGALKAVITDAGEISCDKAVIAIGARSKELARLAGDKVSLESERGYHAVVAAPEAGPRIPTMFADRKVIVTSMERGLRVAGQVEIAQTDDTPDWRRAEILRKHLVALYPKLPADLPTERITIWMGRRPSTPDGLPCIGLASGCADIIHAYGHGHVGLVGSARTGRLVAQLATGTPPEISLAPFSPQRFHSQAQ